MARPPPADTPARRRRQAAHARGLDAEARAAGLLEARGFAILERRLRTGAGELDLVARCGDLLVFCEVKLRADLVVAAESLQPRQRRRIAAAAEAYLATRPELAGLHMRFDAVLLGRDGGAEHLEGAFDLDG
ncbi:YraN family protein [Azorhizobium doebereinerae]|uniref:YraN family protein n=1 Tax=Azorhizobium doebereinerae TaxID=281091 RepID=UPI000422F677|nr:YraN family protein [Azorhizobium doebereinerae]